MNFGNVALLGGMALGAIPIIIHLVNRRRAKLRRFAALEFLLMSDKKLARKLKLKQLVVLALRVALLMALAFALSKPYLDPETAAGPDVSEPGAVVLIVDDSASMLAKGDDGETMLAQAVAAARGMVESGGPRTSFAIITAGAPAKLLTPGLSYDHAVVTRALEKVSGGARASDFEAALREAGRVLSESGERRRHIYVVGDQAAHAWKPLTAPWTWVPMSAVERVSPGVPGGAKKNLAVWDARPKMVDGGALGVDAEIANFGPAEEQVAVEVRVGERVAVELVTVPAGGKKSAHFKLEGPFDAPRGVVKIAEGPGNQLEVDDQFFFVIGERHTVQVLVVNGAPRSTPYLDEVFFLRAAFAATGIDDAPFEVQVVTSAELSPRRLDTADVIVLANVGQLSKEQALAVKQFVERGGGVFITAGDKLVPQAANESYGDLLPFPLREVRLIARSDDPKAVLQAASLASVDFEHPIFSVFTGLEDASLFKAHIFSYVLLDGVGRPEAKVLASATGGAPLMVEAPLGRGRVVFLATSIDRDWADLALRTSFPPLVQRVCGYLARTLERGATAGFVVGHDARVPVPDGNGPVVLMRPDGQEQTLDVAEGARDAFVGAPDLAGHYGVMRAGEAGRARWVAVNADRSESDLSVASESAIAVVVDALLAENGVLPPEIASREGADVPEGSEGEQRGRTVLWPWILASLFVLFGGEAWLLVRS